MQRKISVQKTVILLISITVLMFSLSFALSPFYNTFCKVTGLTRLPTEKEFHEQEDKKRYITVQFTTTKNNNLAWDFYPVKSNIQVHPGHRTHVLFFAKNNTNHAMNVQSIPSITPTLAITHFHKIQCFCFEQQRLEAHESKYMPLVFQIDRKLPPDISVITLSYTLFTT